MVANLSALLAACQELLSDYNDFWVLAGVTDCSFEEGIRSKRFVSPCDSYRDAGVGVTVLEQLRAGVNGNLADLLKERSVPESVRRNKWRGQDLSFQAQGSDTHALAEVKLVFDCTMPKFYGLVAHDWDKLVAVRHDGFEGDLFLVVFFLQLPNHDYPAGRWYGRPEQSLRRSHYLMCKGIQSQFEEVQKWLKVAPAWPGASPHIHPLSSALTLVDAGVFQRRLDSVLKTTAPWRFDPDASLRDAAVGLAIWQIPESMPSDAARILECI